MEKGLLPLPSSKGVGSSFGNLVKRGENVKSYIDSYKSMKHSASAVTL
jgi:hypothetical protein